MEFALLIIQAISGVLLITVILIQSRGTGFARSTHASFTRRGLEKVVFRVTFLLAAIFILVSVLRLMV
jgi:protein translocase SecG subunit